MRILITGATGFIGSHLIPKLLDKDIKIGIIIRSMSHFWRIKKYIDNIVRIECDLNSSHLNQRSIDQIKQFSPDNLIHLAWFGVENRYRNDIRQFNISIRQNTNIITIAKTVGIKAFIGLGSHAEYGPYKKPISEDMKTHPTTMYGVAKLCSYYILNNLCNQNKIRFVWLRLFSGYGPKDNSSWFIPMLILKLLQGKKPDITRGEQKWDFLYVTDIATAITSTVMNLKAHGIYNLGSGKTHTIRSIAEQVRDLINPSLSLGFGKIPYRQDQVMLLKAEISRLQNTTGWSPRTSLNEGLSKTIEWYKKNEILFNS